MTHTTATTSIQIIVFDNPDFGASRRMVDTVRELAVERPDIDVERIDVWQHPDKGVEHDVMTVPTTVICVDGVEQKRICGLRSSRALRRAVAGVTDLQSNRSRRLAIRGVLAR